MRKIAAFLLLVAWWQPSLSAAQADDFDSRFSPPSRSRVHSGFLMTGLAAGSATALPLISVKFDDTAALAFGVDAARYALPAIQQCQSCDTSHETALRATLSYIAAPIALHVSGGYASQDAGTLGRALGFAPTTERLTFGLTASYKITSGPIIWAQFDQTEYLGRGLLPGLPASQMSLFGGLSQPFSWSEAGLGSKLHAADAPAKSSWWQRLLERFAPSGFMPR